MCLHVYMYSRGWVIVQFWVSQFCIQLSQFLKIIPFSPSMNMINNQVSTFQNDSSQNLEDLKPVKNTDCSGWLQDDYMQNFYDIFHKQNPICFYQSFWIFVIQHPTVPALISTVVGSWQWTHRCPSTQMLQQIKNSYQDLELSLSIYKVKQKDYHSKLYDKNTADLKTNNFLKPVR